MPLDLVIHNQNQKIELEALSDGGFRVVLNGVTRAADVQVLPGNAYSILIDGVHYHVDVDEQGEGMEVAVRGHRYPVEVNDPCRGGGASKLGGSSGPAVLKSPMPGKVIKLLVAEGDEVARGAGVIVIEAMKMQNELKAPRAGTIGKVYVAEGANVESGAKLLSIE
jgi:biotin carboxyl carrier protein